MIRRLAVVATLAASALASPVLAGNRLLITGSLGDLLAVSPYTGEVMGKVNLRDPVRLSPVIANRTIYVLTDSGRLIALR